MKVLSQHRCNVVSLEVVYCNRNMVEYNIMKLSLKQRIAQQILAQHSSIRFDTLVLMYSPIQDPAPTKPIIVISVSKKVTPKAVDRNYNKRVLRAAMRESLPKELLIKYNWMWVCKAPLITKELRFKLNDTLKAVKL